MIRKILLDLSQGFPRHWFSGKAFRTQFFNALSMSFPVGEQEFIDSVRDAAQSLPDDPEHLSLRNSIQDFVGQEATHRRIHALYNIVLEKQGLINHWQHWATYLIMLERKRKITPISKLAMTAAFEHYTAVLADWILRYPEVMEDAHPMMRTLWRWHAVEEIEHKSVAFDLYQTLQGSYSLRIRWFAFVTVRFFWMAAGQTLNNLWHDRVIHKPSCWFDAARFLLGRHGLFRVSLKPLVQYLKRDFHPWQYDNRALTTQWLAQNAEQYSVVRGSTGVQTKVAITLDDAPHSI